jgi:hypothetical protein
LKDPNGHFMMFSGLLTHLKNDKSINIGRNSMKGLEDFKKIGDLSAHSRRYNARQQDIDSIKDGLRIASEELLHLAKMA